MSKKQINNSDKLKAKLIREQQKRIKPGECLKYIRAVIGEDVLQPEVGLSLLSQLTDLQISHVLRKQKCNRTIFWERNVGQQIFNSMEDNDLYNLNEKYELEPQFLRIFSGKEFHELIEDKSIHERITNVKTTFPDMKLSLVVVGVLPKCRNTLERETAFVELQILYECSVLFVNNSQGLAELLGRFTKAVAEIPYRKQKSSVAASSSQYLLNDNKDCVRVEGTNGLSRLWQQHLNRLPLVTLDVAQSIQNKYPCPKKLLEEFDNPDGQTSLANLKISRGAVPLASERRIGDVLSKKLYALYNSLDPNEIL
ncbi:crossover junction endonuclease EME1 [Episyrphus balteatus]|uniref:crossover junction endonuclease EME1 n=1 Tax=Episyrphus balteatus TaxID=286459 RepID=UPI0024854117|nr:crossover junction endonuclease EME1 [Episyrphus balteatus]